MNFGFEREKEKYKYPTHTYLEEEGKRILNSVWIQGGA